MRALKLKASLAACALVGGTVTALAVAPAASAATSAATPGSSCQLFILYGLGGVAYPGTVSADGTTCVPNAPIVGAPQTDAGVACGTYVDTPIGSVGAYCPS